MDEGCVRPLLPPDVLQSLDPRRRPSSSDEAMMDLCRQCSYNLAHVDDCHLHALMRTRRGVGTRGRCATTDMMTCTEQRGAAEVSGLRVSAAAAEQVAVVVATKLTTEEVECQRVYARVDERQAIGDDLEDVPEHVVLRRVEMVPEVPDVTRQPAHNEDDHERQHKTSHLLASFHLQHEQIAKCEQNLMKL